MNEAILLFSSRWSLLPKKYHRSLYMNSHVVLEVIAFIGVLFGFFSIYINKENNGKPHFTSWHGFLGLVQIAAVCAQVLIGTFAKYPKIVPGKSFPAAKLKTFHGVLGVCVIILATANLVSGWYSTWFTTNSHMSMVFLFPFISVCFNGFISLRVFTTNSRIKNLLK